MKLKGNSQSLVTSAPTESVAGDDVRSLKTSWPKKSLSLVTSSPTKRITSRAAFRSWRASLPTQLERDTLLMPEAIAESVVQEAERFLNAELPADFAERLAAKAHYLYPRHRHFHKMLNRPGNRGRDNLYVYMRHWTASWLKRERYGLFKRLPWEYALGRRLPVTAPGAPRHYPGAKKLVTEDCIRPS